MKRRVHQTLLVIGILLVIPVISTYLDCCHLVEVDFFSLDLSFENPDEEVLLMDQQNESKAVVFSALSTLFPREIILVEQSPSFPYIMCFLDQKTFIVRC
jgi:hypothetical protein